MKFKSSKKKILTIIIVSVVALLVIGIVSAILIINNIVGNQISHIVISSLPTKTSYYIGEDFDTNGLSIQVVLKNGNFYYADLSQCELTGFDSSKVSAKQTINVTYQEVNSSFSISIKEPPKPTPSLVAIRFSTYPKTEYKVGEWLETQGGVLVREYSDGSTKLIDLRGNYIQGYSESISNTPGVYELTVFIVENGDLATCTYTITVNP